MQAYKDRPLNVVVMQWTYAVRTADVDDLADNCDLKQRTSCVGTDVVNLPHHAASALISCTSDNS